jgi:type IV pilus assembly protein PilA
VTFADLAHSIGGPLSVSIAAGELSIDARIPLKDTAPAKKVIAHCTDIAALAMIGAKLDGDACHVPVPQYNFAIDLWVDGKELRIGTKNAAAPSHTAPASAIGAEIANNSWQVAFWGHGTLLAPSTFALPTAGVLPDEAVLAIRAMIMLNEVGIGVTLEGDSVRFVTAVRTAWANPDDVVAKITAVPADDVISGKAGDRGKAIADAAPGSPFAADYQAGSQGVMIQVAAIGVLAAVAVPAFLDYMKKSKPSEAERRLKGITELAKVYYAEHGGFPIGKAEQLPPFSTCCGLSSTGNQINNKCPNDSGAWRKDKVWAALQVVIDEPTMYRYAYSSDDGKTFLATATSDLDCDGEFATWRLEGRADNGIPTVNLIKPAPGTY